MSKVAEASLWEKNNDTSKTKGAMTPGVYGKKKYCTHWIRTGNCDYVQEGCRYLHVIPDEATRLSIGIRDMPRWAQEDLPIPASQNTPWRHRTSHTGPSHPKRSKQPHSRGRPAASGSASNASSQAPRNGRGGRSGRTLNTARYQHPNRKSQSRKVSPDASITDQKESPSASEAETVQTQQSPPSAYQGAQARAVNRSPTHTSNPFQAFSPSQTSTATYIETKLSPKTVQNEQELGFTQPAVDLPQSSRMNTPVTTSYMRPETTNQQYSLASPSAISSLCNQSEPVNQFWGHSGPSSQLSTPKPAFNHANMFGQPQSASPHMAAALQHHNHTAGLNMSFGTVAGQPNFGFVGQGRPFNNGAPPNNAFAAGSHQTGYSTVLNEPEINMHRRRFVAPGEPAYVMNAPEEPTAHGSSKPKGYHKKSHAFNNNTGKQSGNRYGRSNNNTAGNGQTQSQANLSHAMGDVSLIDLDPQTWVPGSAESCP